MVWLFPALDLDQGRELVWLVLLGVLAEWLAVPLPQGQLSGGFAVIMASLLIYGGPAAVWITGTAALIGMGVVNRGNSFLATLFNTGQYIVAGSAAYGCYRLLGGTLHFKLNNLLPLLVYTGIYFALNHLLVYYYLSPYKREQPISGHWDALRWDGYTYLITIPVGLLMAMVYEQVGLLGSVLMFLPVLAVQFIMRMYVRLELSNRELTALYQVARRLSASLNLQEILDLVLQETRRVVPYHTGVIFLWSDEEQVYLPAAVQSPFARELQHTAIAPDEGFMGGIIQTREPVIVDDARHDSRVTADFGPGQFLRSLLVIPLTAENEVLGVFMLGDKSTGAYDDKKLQTLTIIGGQAAVAMANAMLYRQLEKTAVTDGLTGLYNHRHFHRQAEQELAQVGELEQPAALLLIDIDRFKTFNDRYGHLSGDVVLAKTAALLQACTGPEDLVARYGGEEFTILLKNNTAAEALAIANAICDKVRACRIFLPECDLEVGITVSIGVADCPRDAGDLSGLLGAADMAMYRAKELGRNRVLLYSQILKKPGKR